MVAQELQPNDDQFIHIPTPVRFVAADGADPEVVWRAEILNDSLEGLSFLTQWSTIQIDNLRDHPNESISYVIFEGFNASIKVVDMLHDFAENLSEDHLIHMSHFVSNRTKKLLHVSPNLVKPVDTSQQEIIVTTTTDVRTVAWKIREGCHSLRNVVGNLAFIENRTRMTKRILLLQETMIKIQKSVGNLFLELTDTYDKDKQSVFQIIQTAEGLFLYFYTNLSINVESNRTLWLESPINVLWSNTWCESLLLDIAQNIKRAGAKNAMIWATLTREGAKKWIDIFVDDDGQDPDDDIVEHGFQEGVSYLGGEGIGMAHHAKVLREHYNGDLTLEYRTDKHGVRIPGARVHIRLPAHTYSNTY
jgi:hypothetical protein